MTEKGLTKEQEKAIKAFESVVGLPIPECDLDEFLQEATELGEKAHLYIAMGARETARLLGGGLEGKQRAARHVKRVLRKAKWLRRRNERE